MLLVVDGRWPVSLISDTARGLLEGNADVASLFANTPFLDAPPTMVRMIVYRFTYTDLKTHRETGRYWNKEYVGEYAQPLSAPRR